MPTVVLDPYIVLASHLALDFEPRPGVVLVLVLVLVPHSDPALHPALVLTLVCVVVEKDDQKTTGG